jgi:hypothetical protein
MLEPEPELALLFPCWPACRRRPWEVDTQVDMAFPCATQNEVGEEDAQQLVDHGCKYVFEGEPRQPRGLPCLLPCSAGKL